MCRKGIKAVRNRVKQFRHRLKLSQRQLAAAVGTSQQQIQRIETGAIATRLDLATKLSKALGESLDVVFPGSSKALRKFDAELRHSTFPPTKTYAELNEHGIEGDSRVWFLKILLRGHADEVILEVPPAERRRVFSAIQRESDALSFAIFDSDDARIALNLGEVAYAHFLFNRGRDRDESQEEVEENDSRVEVYFGGCAKPFTFDADPDEADLDDEGGLGDFGNIFFLLGLSPEAYARYRFTDADDEDVFLRAGDIALLKVPLWIVEPESLDAGEEEGDGGTRESVDQTDKR